MAKKEDIKDAGKSAAGTQESGSTADDNQGPTTTEIETVEDLEACYPQLVSEIRDEVLEKIEKCPVQELKGNLPELYQRIVMDIQKRSAPNLNVPGFLLEVDDPFAEATLRTYERLKGISGLRLPFVLPFKDKGTGEIRERYWRKKFDASAALKAEFKDLSAYLAFKCRIITQVLESYVLIADGAGDFVRTNAARKAMKKIK